MWLWVSIPIVLATMSATRESITSAAQSARGRSMTAAPAVIATVESNCRLEWVTLVVSRLFLFWNIFLLIYLFNVAGAVDDPMPPSPSLQTTRQ